MTLDARRDVYSASVTLNRNGNVVVAAICKPGVYMALNDTAEIVALYEALGDVVDQLRTWLNQNARNAAATAAKRDTRSAPVPTSNPR